MAQLSSNSPFVLQGNGSMEFLCISNFTDSHFLEKREQYLTYNSEAKSGVFAKCNTCTDGSGCGGSWGCP